ncbi:MAG: hypothetical protein KQI35_04795 [Bacteroidetes bacterium]|nr:hypothetical protein [Bacteroidota bacterium]
MKKIIIILISSFLLLLSPVFINSVFADAPPDPGGDPNGTGGGTPVGGSPIGSGMVLLMSLGAAYGIKKVYRFNQSDEAD